MIDTVYFYSSTEKYDPDWIYHEYVCLAEGFQKLSIKCFGNRNMYKGGIDKEYLICYEKDFNPVDAAIIFFHFSLYLLGRKEAINTIKNFTRQNKKAVFVFIDAADGVRTPGFDVAPFCDIVLKCHYNIKYHYPDNFIPWQFGFNSRILNAIDLLEYSKRENDILVNFRPQHQLREIVGALIKPIIEPYFNWNTIVDSCNMENFSEEDKLLYKQARGRHIPAYYQRLSRSKLCACYGGVFAIPYGNHDKYFAKIARAINKIIPLFEYDRVRQWDSWRLWEAWVAGCTVLHIDFEKYGCKLPVMPQNGKHYIGIDIKNLSSLRDIIGEERRGEERRGEIAANGREFVINNYSPEKIAERLLNILC